MFFLGATLHAQNISGTWTGLLDAKVMKLHIVFHFQKDNQGKDVCFMDSPDQSAKGIPTSLLYISSDSVSVSVPAASLSFTGKRNDKEISGTFTQMGQRLPLLLKEGAIQHQRPQHPKSPFPYTTEEVTFDNQSANVTLAGTLTYPIGYHPGQKVPIVLMVTGSGPENRDSEIYDHKPFFVIADYLAKNGIATLRYDDRAVGKSTGTRPTTTTLEVADDAQAGIKYLRQLDKFTQVGILGHSEGASVAFILGAKKSIDFAISMAGIGVNGGDVLYEQAKSIVELSGQKYPMTKEQLLNTIKAQHNPWLDYFVNYDPLHDIQQTTCPVFALNGDKDLQVIAKQNFAPIKKHIQNNPKSKAKIYPALNHLFQECTTGLPTEYTGIEQTISPIVLKDIAEWIKSVTK